MRLKWFNSKERAKLAAIVRSNLLRHSKSANIRFCDNALQNFGAVHDDTAINVQKFPTFKETQSTVRRTKW